MHVVATDIDAAAVQTTCAGTSMAPLRHDVTIEADWNGVFDHVASQCGRLDVLVNNAGVMMSAAFNAAPLEHLHRQYRINVESVFMGMQGAIPLMTQTVKQHGVSPSVINVSCIYGQVAGAQYAAYSASKGAVRMLSKATATNLGADWDPPVDEAGHGIPPDVALANWVRLIPMGRIGAVGDIAPVIAFLAGDAAGYITGAELVVDGGYTAI